MTVPRARLIAFALTIAATVVVWTAPIYAQPRTHGPAAMIRATAIPLLLAFLPLVLPRLQRFIAVLLLVFAYIGGMSIGMFYLPAAIVMFFAEPPPRTPAR
jgi:hypothetical protein